MINVRYVVRQGPGGPLDDYGVWDRTLRQWTITPRYSERRAQALADVQNGQMTSLPAWW